MSKKWEKKLEKEVKQNHEQQKANYDREFLEKCAEINKACDRAAVLATGATLIAVGISMFSFKRGKKDLLKGIDMVENYLRSGASDLEPAEANKALNQLEEIRGRFIQVHNFQDATNLDQEVENLLMVYGITYKEVKKWNKAQ